MKIFDFLKPATHVTKLPAAEVDAAYKKYRYQNFIGICLGYACYYLLRGNFSLAMPHLVSSGFTKTQLGVVLSSLSLAYGISKFLMGNLSDRSNPRYFITVGLAISVIVNLVFGCVAGVTTSLAFMYILIFINGWAQGMGAPPCYRTAAHWFSISERGRIMSFWNVSHNVGAGLLSALAMLLLQIFTWKSIFYVPAVIVMLLTAIVTLLMRDTPQSVGLMPIEEYRNEYPKDKKQDSEKELTSKEILLKYVLVNKYVWFLALANIFVYFIRYGVLNWAPTYLTEVKGSNIAHSYLGPVIYEVAGIVGILVCGFVSDKLFKGKRAPVSILCMTIVCLGILLYWLSPYIIVSHIALLLIGMFIYGPIMLVGVQVLDIMPKKAVGTTIGLLGLFGYWGGTMAATAGFGYLVDLVGWNGGFITLVVSSILAILFFSMTLRVGSITKLPTLEPAVEK